jgi:hypothetical protein
MRRRRSPPSVPAIGATPPRARTGERSLPRAYVARRRTGTTPSKPMPRYEDRPAEPAPVMPAADQHVGAEAAESIAAHAQGPEQLEPSPPEPSPLEPSPLESSPIEPSTVDQTSIEAPLEPESPMLAVEQLSAEGVLIEKPREAEVARPVNELADLAGAGNGGALPPLGAARPFGGVLPPVDVPPSPRPRSPLEGQPLAPHGAARQSERPSHEPTLRERICASACHDCPRCSCSASSRCSARSRRSSWSADRRERFARREAARVRAAQRAPSALVASSIAAVAASKRFARSSISRRASAASFARTASFTDGKTMFA